MLAELTKGSSGSGLDEHPFRFIAEKLPLGFRFPEAAIPHCVQATLSCLSKAE